MAPKKFEELKERLRALKTEQRELQVLYEERASQRLEYQNKMADLNLMLQNRSEDIMLIEDVVVITLAAENDARERYTLMPPAPTKTPIQVEPGQKTKSLEEACNIYRSQIEVLEEMIEHRRILTATERDLDLLYRQAVDDILDIMEEYCDDEKLKGDMLSFALGGSAPCSPRKEKKKGVLSRILLSPGALFSPKKVMVRDSMQNELLPTPLSVEPPETPKQAFSHFKESAKYNELKATPLIDLSENDGNEGDMHDPENDQTTTEQAGSSDPTERRKKKKKNKVLPEGRDNGVETESNEKKKKKKKKNTEGVTDESTTPEVLASPEATNEKVLNAETEAELIEKKKRKKKKKQAGDVSETTLTDLVTEAVTAEAPLEEQAEKATEKKKKKKQKVVNPNEAARLESKPDVEQDIVANGPLEEEAIGTSSEMKERKDKYKQQSGNGDLVDRKTRESDMSAKTGDEATPTEKKKKKTRSKSKGTEDGDPPPLVDDEVIADSQGNPKRKKKKKLKDNEEAEIELENEKIIIKKKKKKKDREVTNGDPVTTGRKTDL